ncbi:15875_t:CDS:2 [Entrophospora sp. SA101]|nr:15875_t:CDS:2 [Entrophospora sp. SA101]CAJ0848449.1 6424_t:CDS:2 [Entrophospora sp. SA101]
MVKALKDYIIETKQKSGSSNKLLNLVKNNNFVLNELINIEDDELYNLDVQSIDHPAMNSGGK